MRAACVDALLYACPKACEGMTDSAIAGLLHSSTRPEKGKCSVRCSLACLCRGPERLDAVQPVAQSGHDERNFISVIVVAQQGVGTLVDSGEVLGEEALLVRIREFHSDWDGDTAALHGAHTLLDADEITRRLLPCALVVRPGDIIVLDAFLMHAGPVALRGRATYFYAFPADGARAARLYSGADHIFGWQLALRHSLGLLGAHLLHTSAAFSRTLVRFPSLMKPMVEVREAGQALHGAAVLMRDAAAAALAANVGGNAAALGDVAAVSWQEARARQLAASDALVSAFTAASVATVRT